MSIDKIVEQAIKIGYLTPEIEAELGRFCDQTVELSVEDYMALDRLMEVLLAIPPTSPRKYFVNVMEGLVMEQIIGHLTEIGTNRESTLDLGDIAPYALNRLPHLYATTVEGTNFQRQRAQAELQELIVEQVQKAIAVSLQRPNLGPDRQPLRVRKGKRLSKQMIQQMNTLLQSQAPNLPNPSVNYSESRPLLPLVIAPGQFRFLSVPTGVWCAPPTAPGFRYAMTSTALFTRILNFPQGFDGFFTVSVGERILGHFNHGDRLDFIALCGRGIAEFTIIGIKPAQNASDADVFPVQLEFSHPLVSFEMRSLEESKP